MQHEPSLSHDKESEIGQLPGLPLVEDATPNMRPIAAFDTSMPGEQLPEVFSQEANVHKSESLPPLALPAQIEPPSRVGESQAPLPPLALPVHGEPVRPKGGEGKETQEQHEGKPHYEPFEVRLPEFGEVQHEMPDHASAENAAFRWADQLPQTLGTFPHFAPFAGGYAEGRNPVISDLASAADRYAMRVPVPVEKHPRSLAEEYGNRFPL